MYTTEVTTQDAAVSHLFFHCCLKDGSFTHEEMEQVAGKLVALGLQSSLHVKDELVRYRNYKSTITDEPEYLQYLSSLISPVNTLALYSYCIELSLGDAAMDVSEDALLQNLGTVLKIEEDEQRIIQQLMVQRKVVESQKLF